MSFERKPVKCDSKETSQYGKGARHIQVYTSTGTYKSFSDSFRMTPPITNARATEKSKIFQRRDCDGDVCHRSA